MKPTLYLRHVFRDANDGNGNMKVLALQQWYECEGHEHEDYLKLGGEWRDVKIVTIEDDIQPEA